jgi:hypothetical protein
MMSADLGRPVRNAVTAWHTGDTSMSSWGFLSRPVGPWETSALAGVSSHTVITSEPAGLFNNS